MHAATETKERRRAGIRWLWLAACAGCLHAAFSFYWAAGGTWLLATVGQWAVQAAADGGPPVMIGLAGVGVFKLVAALAPPIAEQHAKPRLRQWTRVLGWIGAVGLMVYGGTKAVVAALVLVGVVQPEGGHDRDAMIGQALLWDPLFFFWGLLLTVGLALTTTDRTTKSGPKQP